MHVNIQIYLDDYGAFIQKVSKTSFFIGKKIGVNITN